MGRGKKARDDPRHRATKAVAGAKSKDGEVRFDTDHANIASHWLQIPEIRRDTPG